MPVKQQQRQQVNTFIGGFITEGSPLLFPPEATRYEQNFEIDRRGFRKRRKGFDVAQTLLSNTDQDINSVGFNIFLWKGAGGDTATELLVVQVGAYLYFFDYTTEPYKYINKAYFDYQHTKEISFTTVDGKLIMVDGGEDIFVVDYKRGQLVTQKGRLKIRDLWGIEEEPEYEEDANHRGANTPRHKYNLQNQSWGVPRYAEVTVPVYRYRQVERPNPEFNPSKPPSHTNPQTVIVTERYQWGTTKSSKTTDPVTVYANHYGKAPSNSEQVWQGIQMQAVTKDQTPFEKMFPAMYEQVLGMYPESAKGYFIIDALNRGASRRDAVNRNNANNPALDAYDINFPRDKVLGGPKIVANFAGRVFYGGITGDIDEPDLRSVSYYDAILFSQLVTTQGDIFKCYQEGDPTSREGHDVVDTDGGMIKVAGMHGLVSMETTGNALILLAANGVWLIKGGGNYGFTATNYSVEKLSTHGCVSKQSIVVVGEEIYFWSKDGIYKIGKDQFGEFVVESITAQRIHQYYNSLTALQKVESRGGYSETRNEISWLINEQDGTTELKLDLLVGAYSLHKIRYVDNSQIVFMFPRQGIVSSSSQARVLSGNDPVYAGDKEVVADIVKRDAVEEGLEYVVINRDESSVSIARKTRDDYKDWGQLDAKGILETGENTAGDIAADKQINYLDVFVKREEEWTEEGLRKDSSCLLTTNWNFSSDLSSGKSTIPEQVFRPIPRAMKEVGNKFETPFYVQKTRITPRGSGVAVSLRFETEEEKGCTLYGWSISWTGNPIT